MQAILPPQTAVLVVNMGGPESLGTMRQFLWNMFTDVHILPFARPFRWALAQIITRARYKKSWAKYELIGGTPLHRSTRAIAEALAQRLGAKPDAVAVAYSYTLPSIGQQLETLQRAGHTQVWVASLYPHYSITTWQSVHDEVQSHARRLGLDTRNLLPYYAHPSFVEYWVQAIARSASGAGFDAPYLLFSGHSIPNTFLKRGDCYAREIEESARLIAGHLGWSYGVSYQSQIGKRWLGPVTEEVLGQLAGQGQAQVLVVPISFVNENLETLYDIDQVMLPQARRRWPQMQVSRAQIPMVDQHLVEALGQGIEAQQFEGCGRACSLCQRTL